MNKLLAAASALTLVAMTSQAFADQGERWPRWYVGVTGGVAFLSDQDITGAETGKAKYQTGGEGTVSLGYMPPLPGPILDNMRVEAQFGYLENKIDSLRTNAGENSNGALRSLAYMGNLYYDFRNGSQWTPYIGAGAGIAQDKINRNTGLIGTTGDTDNVFAYQGMAGISYAPTSIPMTEWSLGYRFFGTQRPEFTTTSGDVKLDREISSSAEIGAKFRF